MAADTPVLLGLLLLVHVAVAQTTGDCPTRCECSSWLGTYVACRGTQLAETPLNTYTPELESLYFTYNKNMVVLRNDELYNNEYAAVRVLILNNNAINTVEANAFRGMNNIKQLDLSGNGITTIPVEVFATLQRLSRLNLFNNKELVLPEEGWILPKLTLLILRGCNLENIPVNFFEGMPNLKNIKLDRNKFSVIDANVFHPVIQNLKILDLSINKFTKMPRGILELIPEAVELHLEYNRFNCDCEFTESYCLYGRRSIRPRLQCKTPKRMRGVDGSDVRKILNCDEEWNATSVCKHQPTKHL